ncbi:MAG: hypothetical protein JST92_02525, partial [Deltaproteobacteria bacterium]|nr:hypothetical protein [Deltaproteobacteria bacterium]
MDTFDLLPALADGELEQTSAPELVAAIVRTRASGTLSIENGEGVEIRQFFRAGAMCGSAYFAGFRTLAQVLLANDWVNALEIDASLAEAQASGKRHGQVLVEKGLLTADQLKQALATQHRQNLGNLLALQRGHYEMRGWEPPPAWSKELQIDPLGPLVTALGDERASPRRQKVIDWLGSHAVRLSVDWPEISARVELDAAERRAAALLALPRKRDEFLRLSHLPTDRADGLLVGLLLAGAAEPHPLGASANADQMVPQHTPPQPYQQPAHTPQPYQQPPPSYPPPAYPQYGQPGYPAAPIPTPYTSIPPMMVPVPMVQSPYGAPVVMQPYAPPYPPYGSQPPPVSPMAPMSPPPPLRQEPDALDLVPLDPEPRPPQPPAPPLSQPPPSSG